jgi:two-component system response regulator
MFENAVEVLVVEDNPSDLELTLRALREHKLCNRIQVARDGAEAMDYIFGEGEHAGRPVTDQPRVVLLDLKLPLVDGMEVLRRIRSDPRTKTLPVVVMTSSSHERDVSESYNLGVNSYIVKPVDFEKFAHSMKIVGMYWIMLNHPPGNGKPVTA